MKRSLSDMVVIITGASAGIGRALAVELGRRGARLALAARRADRLEELNRELGGVHLCIEADVSQTADCIRIIEQTIQRFGRIDTLVCNAGYGFHMPVAQTTDERMLAVFQTNVIGTLACIRAAAPYMQKQDLRDGCRGQIMIVSSAVARRSLPYFGAYSATKAAQLSLAEAMRVEISPELISVTTVHPGGTETEFGEVSASLSGGKRPGRIAGEIEQTAQDVAKAMVRAIERPRPEVWPIGLYRWATGLGTLMPAIVDRLMSKRRENMVGEK
jgi:short-subunit dehydrogenase